MGAESRRHADRARQFMPFASLRGYYDFIREQERVKEPRRELSEDGAQELSDVLGKTARGVMLRVVFYDKDHYETAEGLVSEFDPVFRSLCIVRRKIPKYWRDWTNHRDNVIIKVTSIPEVHYEISDTAL